MKRTSAIAAVTAAALALSLAACGSADSAAASSAPAESTAASTEAASPEAAPSKAAPAGDFDTDQDITVISREDGSGTRGAFVELLGIEQADANGDKVDMTTSTAAITNSTAVMMTSVAGDPECHRLHLAWLAGRYGEGGVHRRRCAFGCGCEGRFLRPSPALQRGDQGGSVRPGRRFFAFIMSADGQAVVSDNNYIAIDDAAAPFASNGASGKVVVAGSSSVTPVMEKLAEAFQAANPQVTVEVQQSDSTTGVNMAVDGTCDIGMVSRELKDSESGVKATVIAQDGIAVIVNPDASIDELTSDQVKGIYTGELTTWEDVVPSA